MRPPALPLIAAPFALRGCTWNPSQPLHSPSRPPPLAGGVGEGPGPPPPPANRRTADIASAIKPSPPPCHSPTGAGGRKRTPTRSLDLPGDPADPVFGLVNVPSTSERGWPEPLL